MQQLPASVIKLSQTVVAIISLNSALAYYKPRISQIPRVITSRSFIFTAKYVLVHFRRFSFIITLSSRHLFAHKLQLLASTISRTSLVVSDCAQHTVASWMYRAIDEQH